ARKIDTGTETIHIVDATPTGNRTLDRVMAEMARRPDLKTVRQWIEEIFQHRRDWEGEALASLIASGILRHEKSKLLWVIDVERFPLVDGRHQRHVQERLRHAILNDEIPDTRDIILLSLAEPCGLLPYILNHRELEARKERIRMLSSLETISRKVTAAIVSLDATMRAAMTKVV
ncbi:MAG TPA: GPP34 family phosphoprotein, partial [Candidatus Sulfopaludibacter sp.]|nr:GPP34 family phosphoprotein [Candidatus Sulfopaludibacter sp.]